jgi:hypothetical protein
VLLLWAFVLMLNFRHYRRWIRILIWDFIKKLTPHIFSSKIQHENDDIFKNALSKKGLE